MRNIILIGMMGSGKSTIGAELQNHLNDYTFVDTDKEIERGTGINVSEIFEKFGERYFRQLETDKIIEISKKNSLIISTGGGVFENAYNREILLNSGKVFYLKASAETIYERIKNQTHRPLLKNDFSTEKISEIIETRKHNYEQAHHIIDTDSKTAYNIVNEIMEVLND